MSDKMIVNSHKKSGESFDKLVTAFQKEMDSNSTVTHNEKIRDTNGILRQFDVVVRGKVNGFEVLCVIECKDRIRPAGIKSIEAFSRKAESVKADTYIFISKKGFSKSALRATYDDKIIPLSLLPNPKNGSDDTIGMNCYVELYSWTKLQMVLHFFRKKVVADSFHPSDVTWKNFRILDMFRKKLVSVHGEEKQGGWHEFKVDCKRPRRFSINSKKYLVKDVKFRVLREYRTKIKWIPFNGEAYFDWNVSKIIIPSQSTIWSTAFKSDFSDWDDYDGELPHSTGVLDLRYTAFLKQFDPNTDLPDLYEM